MEFRKSKIIFFILILAIIPLILIINNSQFKFTKGEPVEIIGDKQLKTALKHTGEGTKIEPYILENITLTGIDFRGNGIYIQDTTKFVIIRNCILSNFENGIHILNCENIKTINCTFSNNTNGLHLENSYLNSVSNCNLFYNLNGIILKNSYFSYIEENHLENNEIYAIILNVENINYLHSNIMINCGVGFSYLDIKNRLFAPIIDNTNLINESPIEIFIGGTNLTLNNDNYKIMGQILLINCNNTEISNYIFRNASLGISIWYCQNIFIKNISTSFVKWGISLHNSSNIFIEHCEFSYANQHNLQEITYACSGIIVSRSNLVNISENNFIKNFYGISIFSSTNAYISNNNISESIDHGIHFNLCLNSTVVNNNIFCSNNGIYLYLSKEINISSNSIANSTTDGICHMDSSENTISNNTILYNSHGIFLCGERTLIISNLFLKNKMDIDIYHGVNNSIINNFSEKSLHIINHTPSEINKIANNTII